MCQAEHTRREAALFAPRRLRRRHVLRRLGRCRRGRQLVVLERVRAAVAVAFARLRLRCCAPACGTGRCCSAAGLTVGVRGGVGRLRAGRLPSRRRHRASARHARLARAAHRRGGGGWRAER
eukprot:354798-Chlamydomonas_euryale.AAC.1